MKRTLLIITISLLAAYSTSLFSQNCGFFLPLKANTGTEMKSYDSNNLHTGTDKNTITSVETEGANNVANIKNEHKDELKGGTTSNDYKVKCNGTQLSIDNKALLGTALNAYNEMEIKIDGGEIEFPNNLAVGSVLNDSKLKMEVYTNGTLVGVMDYLYTNRKVVSKESITTPAGTYNCYKMTYDMVLSSKIMTYSTKTTTKIVDYYTENIGLVKSQIYNDKGELISYNVLNKIF